MGSRQSALLAICAAALMAGALSALLIATPTEGSTVAFGLMGPGRPARVALLAQYALFLPAAAAVARLGVRYALSFGIYLLLLATFVPVLIGGPAGLSLAQLAEVAVGGALVLTAGVATLRVHGAGRRWWLLTGGLYLVGLWTGWGMGPLIGPADWWLWAVMLVPPIAMLAITAHRLPRPVDGPRLRPDWWAAWSWSGGVAALGLVTVDPGPIEALAAVALLGAYAWRQRRRLGALGVVPLLVMLVCFALWIIVAAIALLQGSPSLGQLSALIAFVGVASLLAAVASHEQVRLVATDR